MSMYTYRADGMRVYKGEGIIVFPSGLLLGTQYRYDVQMGFEDLNCDSTNTTVTDYALGARGVDGMSVSKNGGSAVLSYPLYDAHGNMVMTISRSGTNNYAPAMQERSFDAWGNIRIGLNTGDPAGRYCANLGHKQDDESGLIYMRARYYEPNSGRFISEDPSRGGVNWYSYANARPCDSVDKAGRFVDLLIASLIQDWAEQVDASMSAMAKQWAENKAQGIASRYAGEVMGWLASEMIDDLDYSIAPAGVNLWRVGEGAGNYVHIDLEQGIFEKGFFGPEGSVIHSQDFFEGFMQGFFGGLGIG